MRKFIEKDSQINWLDERYYFIKNEYYPSATFILQSYPKGAAFAEFLKMAGPQAKYIANKAAEAGTRVHKAIEYLSIGMEITWDDKINNEEEWAAICKFKAVILFCVDYCLGYTNKLQGIKKNERKISRRKRRFPKIYKRIRWRLKQKSAQGAEGKER